MIRCTTVLVLLGTLVPLAIPASAAAHSGHSMREPWEVCQSASLGEACEWTNKVEDRYIGTCREVSDALVCVRNQPIIKSSRSEHEHHGHHHHGAEHGEAGDDDAIAARFTDAQPPSAGPMSSRALFGGLLLLGAALFGLRVWSRGRRTAASALP